MQIEQTEATGSNLRMYERYPCPHHAQAFFASQWRDCTVDDISAVGANILTANRPAVGDSVTLFVEDVAEMPGVVLRHTGDGFALRFDLSPLTRH
jgi:hypothetical protein